MGQSRAVTKVFGKELFKNVCLIPSHSVSEFLKILVDWTTFKILGALRIGLASGHPVIALGFVPNAIPVLVNCNLKPLNAIEESERNLRKR